MKKTKRTIDDSLSNIGSWLNKTYKLGKKTEIKTWQGVSALFFVLGIIIAGVLITKMGIQIKSRALGETAEMKLVASKTNVSANEAFTMDIMLNTKGANVLATKAIVSYDPAYFSLDSWSTSSSVFALNNNCQYNGKPCEIISNDKVGGKITLTLAKPKPGVNTPSGKVATLNFHGLKDVQPTSDNIRLTFTSGSYDDSDAIMDDGKGTDILASVVNARVSIGAMTCTSFTYSDWGACQPDGTQTRTVLSSSPAGCTGGNPILKQACTYSDKVVCTKFRYSKWSACDPATNLQSRTVISATPTGCVGGTPILTQTCTKGSSNKVK